MATKRKRRKAYLSRAQEREQKKAQARLAQIKKLKAEQAEYEGLFESRKIRLPRLGLIDVALWALGPLVLFLLWALFTS